LLRELAREIYKQFLQPYWSCAPFAVAIIVTAVAALKAPGSLEDDAVHHEWAGFFETSALLISALLVGLVVEVRKPFARAGERPIRIASVGTAGMLGGAGIGAALALIPSLTNDLYGALFALTLGGLTGGMLAVIMMGISVALGTLDEADQKLRQDLQERGERR
jgi:hypothetical protein